MGIVRMMLGSLLRLTAGLAACGSPLVTNAAEIKSAQSGSQVVLEGRIDVGDCDKIKSLVYREQPDNIFLASPGGNLAEALEIGRFVRALKLKTIVPSASSNVDLRSKVAANHKVSNPKSNYMCASACFFVFVAGVNRVNDVDIDDWHPALLGIHRPFLSENELRLLSADKALSEVQQTRAMVESYFKEMGVPTKYADQMFSVRKDAVRWIGAKDFEADLNGVISGLRDWLDARCGDKTNDAEKAIWENLKYRIHGQLTEAERLIMDLIHKKHTERFDCEFKALYDLRRQAWTSIFGDPGEIYGSLTTAKARSFCAARH
jgi:hypothetical protein